MIIIINAQCQFVSLVESQFSISLLVYLQLFIGGWASPNLSIPWKEVESKLFALNAVSTTCSFHVGCFISLLIIPFRQAICMQRRDK